MSELCNTCKLSFLDECTNTLLAYSVFDSEKRFVGIYNKCSSVAHEDSLCQCAECWRQIEESVNYVAHPRSLVWGTLSVQKLEHSAVSPPPLYRVSSAKGRVLSSSLCSMTIRLCLTSVFIVWSSNKICKSLFKLLNLVNRCLYCLALHVF